MIGTLNNLSDDDSNSSECEDSIIQSLASSIICRYEFDELDEIDVSNTIAFTWTPNPIRYPSSQCRKQYKCLLDYILLSSFKFFSKYCFVPEINTSGNVHIHGWYIIKDRIAYHKFFLPKCKDLGYVLLKTRVDDGWATYLEKDLSDTVRIIGFDLPIPLTHINNKAYVVKKTYQKTHIKVKPRPRSVCRYFACINR